MVLVRPKAHTSWNDVPGFSDSMETSDSAAATTTLNTPQPSKVTSSPTPEPNAAFTPIPCEVGLDQEACGENERCISPNERSRNGVCRCKKGFARWQKDNRCHKEKGKNWSTSTTSSTSPHPTSSSTSPPPKRLTVSVMSKNITIPVNSAELFASAVPEAPEGSRYDYIGNR